MARTKLRCLATRRCVCVSKSSYARCTASYIRASQALAQASNTRRLAKRMCDTAVHCSSAVSRQRSYSRPSEPDSVHRDSLSTGCLLCSPEEALCGVVKRHSATAQSRVTPSRTRTSSGYGLMVLFPSSLASPPSDALQSRRSIG